MVRLTHAPRPPLSQFVHLLWLYEGYTQPHAKERVLPTGEMQIVINLLEDRTCMYDREDSDRFQPSRCVGLFICHELQCALDGERVAHAQAKGQVGVGVGCRPGAEDGFA